MSHVYRTGSPYHFLGVVALRILTFITPTSREPKAVNAAFVRSTCLLPAAHPAQVSITRTKTHLLPKQTSGSIEYRV